MKSINRSIGLLIIFLVVPLALSAKNRKQGSGSSIYQDNKNAVVQVFTYSNHIDLFERHRAPEQSSSRGSGVMISNKGDVITNYHVVESGDCINVQTSLGKIPLKVNFKKGCPLRDVAWLQFTPESLQLYEELTKSKGTPFVELGDSDKVMPGDGIMLLGHPGGEEDVKLSMGYIKGRDSSPMGSLLETTAPMNPGDSGGPCFNEKGEVIGICVGKRSNAEGFGYIIPMANILVILEAFENLAALENEKILRPPLWGVRFTSTNESTRAYLKCPQSGLYICDVLEGGLAWQAGIRRRDIVISVDDIALDEFGDLFVDWSDEKIGLSDYCSRKKIGSDIKVAYYRDGNLCNTTITLAPRVRGEVDVFQPCFEQAPDFEIFGGMIVSQLSLNHVAWLVAKCGSVEPELMKYTQDDVKLEPRLLITSIFQTSKLHLSRAIQSRVGLLSKINGKTVNTIKEFREAVLAGKNDKFFIIETDAGALIALPLQEILKEEDMLSEKYCYKQSDLVDKLKT